MTDRTFEFNGKKAQGFAWICGDCQLGAHDFETENDAVIALDEHNREIHPDKV